VRVVLDSNVLISALIVPTGYPRAVVEAAFVRRYELVSSNHILGEVDRIVRLPRILRQTSRAGSSDAVGYYLNGLRALADIVEPSPSTTGLVRDRIPETTQCLAPPWQAKRSTW
jgi:predicted nucleic acid-binding protein